MGEWVIFVVFKERREVKRLVNKRLNTKIEI